MFCRKRIALPCPELACDWACDCDWESGRCWPALCPLRFLCILQTPSWATKPGINQEGDEEGAEPLLPGRVHSPSDQTSSCHALPFKGHHLPSVPFWGPSLGPLGCTEVQSSILLPTTTRQLGLLIKILSVNFHVESHNSKVSPVPRDEMCGQRVHKASTKQWPLKTREGPTTWWWGQGWE